MLISFLDQKRANLLFDIETKLPPVHQLTNQNYTITRSIHSVTDRFLISEKHVLCVYSIVQTKLWYITHNASFSGGRMDRASATKTEDLSLFPGRVKPKTLKLGIYSFLA